MSTITIPKIEAKAFKPAPHLVHESVPFTVNLYIDGKKAVEVRNDGHGGSYSYGYLTDDAREKLMQAGEAWLTMNGEDTSCDGIDIYVAHLCEESDLVKKARRLTRGQAAGTQVILVQKGAWIYGARGGKERVAKLSDHKPLDLHFDEEFLLSIRPTEDPATVAETEGAQVWRIIL